MHPRREMVVLTSGTCVTCDRPAKRFVTTFGLITTISEWQHQYGNNTHDVTLEF